MFAWLASPKVSVYGICGVVLVAAVLHFALGGQSIPTLPEEDDRINVALTEKYWAARVAAVGLGEAYAEFRDFYADKPLISHTAAHIIGELSYEEAGAAGLAVCDSAFGFGCFHQHVVRSMTDYGVGAVAELGGICIETYGPQALACFHGIGHGIHQYFGQAHLPDALGVCSSMPSAGVRDCERGAFMDYFVPFMIENENPYGQTQPFDAMNPYGICASADVSDPFKSACYFSLPHWWFQQGKTPTEIRAYCAVAGRHADDCYIGMTVDLPGIVGFDTGRIIAECKALPERQMAEKCLRGAAYTLDTLGVENCALVSAYGGDDFGCGEHDAHK